jgi:hypothetical protein
MARAGMERACGAGDHVLSTRQVAGEPVISRRWGQYRLTSIVLLHPPGFELGDLGFEAGESRPNVGWVEVEEQRQAGWSFT